MDLSNKNMEFVLNPKRLIYLLELFKLSKENFLELLKGDNKNPVLSLEEFEEVLNNNKKIKLSVLKKIDKIFEKGITWYISKRDLPDKDKLSIFFRKDTFNAQLNLGSIKLIEEFEKKRIEIESFCNSINFKAERKLKKYDLSYDAKEVAIEIKKEFDIVEERLRINKSLKSSKNDRDYLENLIRMIEEFNVFVFEFIDNKKRDDFIANFNGFFMTSNLIVIKRQQEYLKREIFTLMHEFAHYLIEKEEIDDKVGEDFTGNLNDVEKWCNDFSYYFLIGKFDNKLKFLSQANEKNDFHKDIINAITEQTHLSNFALYTRLRINNHISQRNYNEIYNRIKEKIFEEKQRLKAQREFEKEQAEKEGRTLHFGQKVAIESKLFKELVRINYFEGNINQSRVMESLGVKKQSFEEVIYS